MTAVIENGEQKLLAEKLRRVEESMNERLFEREEVIHNAWMCLVSKTHLFQLGSPGVAKSMLTRLLVDHISGLSQEEYFELLMTRFTTPDEMFGPIDISALKEGRFRHLVSKMLPEAKIVFLDEIYKCNAASLNSLLMVKNERKFRNDGEVIDLPLWSLFSASNELPESDELNALFDRTHVKMEVKPLREGGNFRKMLESNVDRPPIEHKISWEDITKIHEQVKTVVIAPHVYDTLLKVRQDLKSAGLEPTDRKFAESLKLVRAVAWYDGLMVADNEHLTILQDTLWSLPSDKKVLVKVLLSLANPIEQKAQALLDELEEFRESLARIPVEDTTQMKHLAIEYFPKCSKNAKKEKALCQQLANEGRPISVTLRKVASSRGELMTHMKEGIFGVETSLLLEEEI